MRSQNELGYGIQGFAQLPQQGFAQQQLQQPQQGIGQQFQQPQQGFAQQLQQPQQGIGQQFQQPQQGFGQQVQQPQQGGQLYVLQQPQQGMGQQVYALQPQQGFVPAFVQQQPQAQQFYGQPQQQIYPQQQVQGFQPQAFAQQPQQGYAQQSYPQQGQQAALMAAQALGGYGASQLAAWGQEATRIRRGPKNYTRSDDRIREDVCEQLCQQQVIDVSDVSVDVQNGRVVLEGTVPERNMKYAIENMADSCWGVQDVENHIRVRQMQMFGQGQQNQQEAGGQQQGQVRRSSAEAGGFGSADTSSRQGENKAKGKES